MAKRPPDLDLEFLPPRAAALLRVGNKKTYLVQKAIGIFFILFIFWAHYFQLHETTKGTGKVVAFSRTQTINNLEGGIIKEILVHDDEIVEPGQVLVRLDRTISEAKYLQDLENFFRFLAASERLQAQINNAKLFEASPYLKQNVPQIALQEEERFKSAQEKKQNDVDIATQDVQVKQEEVKETETKLKNIRDQYNLVLKQIQITEPLAKKKIYPEMDYLKVRRDMVEQKAQLESLKVMLKRQRATLKQANERLDQVYIRYRNDDLQELRDVEGKLAEARGAQTADWNRVFRTEIRSPVRGTVRDIKLRTVGGVVQPGEAIMDIVPLEDTLLIEAQIAPADIAFLHPGMPATIKITAYDFSNYGGLEAIVQEISPDTITDKREQNYYRILLHTKTNALVKNGKVMPILPGMQVEVDILTGQKSVLTYLMKPFLRALQNSMTER